MMQTMASVLDFLIIAVCWVSIALSVIIYKGRGFRIFLYCAIYAVVQLLVEFYLRISEIRSPALSSVTIVFESITMVIIKSILYAMLSFLLLLIVYNLLGRPLTIGPILCTTLLALWLLVFPLQKMWTGMSAMLYLLPYQVYVIALAVFGLTQGKAVPRTGHSALVRRLMICAAVLTALSIAEDLISILPMGMHANLSAVASGEMKERNICECVLDLLLLCSVIHAGARILLDALKGAQAESEPAPPKPPVESGPVDIDCFADALGLSKREREVLPLLLENKSIEEISKALIISPGTVKSHAHNIYQKAHVRDRTDLVRKASNYLEKGMGAHAPSCSGGVEG